MANYNIQLGVKIDSNAQKSIKEQLKNIEPEITNVKLSNNAIKSIQDQLKGANLGITIDTASIKQAQTEVNKLVSNLKNVSGIKTNINTNVNNTGTNNGSSSINNDVLKSKQTIALNDLKLFWNRYKSITQSGTSEYNRLISQLGNVESSDGLKKLNSEINAFKSSVKLTANEIKNNFDMDKFASDKTSSLAKIEKYMNDNTRAVKEYGSALDSVKNKISSATNPSELKLANAQYKALTNQLDAMGVSGKSFGDKIKETFSGLTQLFSVGEVITKAKQYVVEGFNELIQLDDAMVELKKVTDETADSYKNFYYQANDIAKQLGATTQEVITQTANWAQLGYAMQDAISLAKDSSILSTISPEMNIDTATKTLISTMKAYKIEAKDVRDEISSKINKIGNEFAVDNNGISEILKRSSAAMAAANSTLDQNIALGVAANEIVQDPASVGGHVIMCRL